MSADSRTDPAGAGAVDPTPSGETMVRTSRLSKTYPAGAAAEVYACDQVSIDVSRGEVVAVAGPSGSGKSTLLHLIGGLQAPDAGSIVVAGQEVSRLKRGARAQFRRSVGFVFQSFQLLPTLTALDNVLVPLLPYRTGFDKRTRARQLLTAVGLADRADALPSRLSIGQQQRVAVARALVNEPQLLLADEPTGNLDTQTGSEIIDLLLALRERLGTTMLIATHDATLAGRCDRTLEVRDGVVTDPARVAG